MDRMVTTNLKIACMWNEVGERFDTLGVALFGGQQRRLCIVRANAVNITGRFG